MREIKFRAWDKETKTWSYSPDLNELDDALQWFGSVEDADVAGVVLCQYTGLKDKNGKEIYEGDVVYLSGYGDYQVEWPFVQLYQSAWEKDIGNIKGNIYENPELLEAK